MSTIVTLNGTDNISKQIATISFNIKNMDPAEVGFRLDDEFNIMCRVGLHCSPVSHKTIGTYPQGTIRIGLGFFNTIEEIEFVLHSIKKIAREVK